MSEYRIQGATGEWEVVIGLEVHAQVVSNSKLFSGAATAFGAEPNAQVSLVDAAMPGMLPVPNRECIRQAVRTGMAIDAQINKWSRFDRKNYFYADLPQGYQISQLYHPLVGEGTIDIAVDEKKPDETKNVNSVRFVMQAIEHEANRQVDVLESGGAIVQETRLFDPDSGSTRSMRSKEDAHDYRYFPDPDLLPLELDDAFLDECRASLPELPDAKRHRYESDLGLSAYNAGVLTADVETARWFEVLLTAAAKAQGKSEADAAKQAANWLISELFGALNKLGKSLEDSPVGPEAGAELLALVGDGTISGSIAKQVLEKMLETGDGAATIVEREGLKQESDTGAIETAVDGILAANADKVEQYKAGKEALFGFFVGQTMKAMQGKANPQVVNQILKQKLA